MAFIQSEAKREERYTQYQDRIAEFSITRLSHPIQGVLSILHRDLVVLHGRFGALVPELRLRGSEVLLARHVSADRVTYRIPTHLPVRRIDVRDVAELMQ